MKTLHFLNEKLWFPPVSQALEDGLLAAGGDLRTERLLLAYRNGIFPWYDGDLPLWWCPNPRFVLFPDELVVSKSMKQVLRKNKFQLSSNKDFKAVMSACGSTPRPGQEGTWINEEMLNAYTELHRQGFAISYEAWQNNELVGGLYGLKIGKVFFGESMFSHVSNASKAAFIYAVESLKAEGVVIIDCQVHTEHLQSLGARFIERDEFIDLLNENIDDAV